MSGRGLSGDDEPSDHEQRADEEERRERAGAAGVRRGHVEAGPGAALGPLVVNPNASLGSGPTAAALGATLLLIEATLRAKFVARFRIAAAVTKVARTPAPAPARTSSVPKAARVRPEDDFVVEGAVVACVEIKILRHVRTGS